MSVSEQEKAEARDDSEGKRRRCCGRDLSHRIVLSLLVGSIRYEKLDHCGRERDREDLEKAWRGERKIAGEKGGERGRERERRKGQKERKAGQGKLR